MREELLHFIWRLRYFNQQALATESGERVQILSPGEPHTDQGPDFRNARILLGDRLTVGAVEIHVVTSDWKKHAHDGDPHYSDTILHVVWEDDSNGDPASGNIPILVLRERVSKLLLHRYERWMKNQGFVPCERQLPEVDVQIWPSWLETLTLERLRRKTDVIRQCLEENRQHWEATTWIWMARAIGLPVNGDVFAAIARSLPLELLTRYRERKEQLEALLLGQAGLLSGPGTSLFDRVGWRSGAFTAHRLQLLEREYHFLAQKWGLQPVPTPVSFLRMRPGNFPTVRLVQLAGLYTTGLGWFARIREAGSPAGLWTEIGQQLTPETRDKLVINAFVPLLFAYGRIRREQACREKALRWLRETRAENNTILERWRQVGVIARHAGESQALLELKKEYCTGRRCLDCAIGNRWLISSVNNTERR